MTSTSAAESDSYIENMSRVFVIGAPGAGKGSLCRKLAVDYGFHHLSVGDLLRDLARSGSLKPGVAMDVKRSALIDIDELTTILKSHVDILAREGKHRLLIDGIPRTMNQAAPLEEAIGSPDLVLFFDCPGELARHRFLTRDLLGRIDDEATFDIRYEHFLSQIFQITRYYENMGLLLKVDTSGSVEQSYAGLIEKLSEWKLGV